MTNINKTKQVKMSVLLDKLADLGWEYTCNRMSRSGMACYDALAVNLGILNDGEHWCQDAYEDKNCDH